MDDPTFQGARLGQNVFKVVKRRPVFFPLVVIAAMAMVLMSEAAYWRSARTLHEIAATGDARTRIQDLRQSVLAAQTAQRSYLLTESRKHLASYSKALNDMQAAFAFLQERYRPAPTQTVVLTQLQGITEALVLQLGTTINQHDRGQPVVLEDGDDAQVESIRALSAELLNVEDRNASTGQYDVYQTLLLSGIGVALLSAISLLALVMYLRQSFALERQQQDVQRIAQTERDQLEIEVRQRTAQLTELTHHLQSAREDERHRLARNLHDDLGALLTSAKLDAARIRSRLVAAATAPEALDLLAHLVATLNSGIALGRRIIEDLRPSALGTLGLVATLEILVGEYAEHAGLRVHSVLEPVSLDENAELMVYRLVQEALTNISKHAKASEVWVNLGLRDGLVEVSVRDNGVGFNTQVKATSAYGLVGMRFRVEAEGGTLSVVSAPQQGTLIQVRIPQAEADPH
ncbi:MAG: CHASE3 domain-containing protein [Candidatus Saccharibacteria bacterium]|nr:CHASE3 domain-containing protein [Rhodoferax sp.]